MAVRQNVDYGLEIQQVYLEMMLQHSESFARCQSIFNVDLFDKRLQKTAKFIYDYVNDYNAMPKLDTVNAATKSNLRAIEGLVDSDFDWLLNDFETFIRHKGLHKAIIDSSDLLENGEYGAVEDLIKKAVQVGLTKDLGTDYFLDPKTRLLRIKDNNGQQSTGWPALDQILYGGFSSGSLNIFVGGSGTGKSLFLGNLAVNYSLSGKAVLYLTYELSEDIVSMRMDSMISGVPCRNIFKQIDDVDVKVKQIGNKAGSMQVKYLPSGRNVNDIRSYLKEFEIKTSKKIEVLVVDYMDLLMPASKKISAENLFIKDKFVSEELRNLAVEKNLIVISASQGNRSSVNQEEMDHTHISGGLSKIQTADNVFGIYITNEMRENGEYQLQILKTRNSSGTGKKIPMVYNVETLRITDEGGTVADAMFNRKSNDLSETLKRTSSVGQPTGQSKLRSLIN
jgi:archaellum biogenesis ATPase FlaH